MSATTTKTAATKSNKPATKANHEANGKKNGLRKPMVRILKALAKAGKPLTRNEISAKAPVDVATCVEYLGSPDEAKRKANDKKHFPSLVSMGLVRFAEPEGDARGSAYEITKPGKAALAKAE